MGFLPFLQMLSAAYVHMKWDIWVRYSTATPDAAYKRFPVFGWPDLYDIDNSSAGIGSWCLMGSGNWGSGGDRPVHPSACKLRIMFFTNVSLTRRRVQVESRLGRDYSRKQ